MAIDVIARHLRSYEREDIILIRCDVAIRVIPSAGTTRHQRYHDPLRLPDLAVILTMALEVHLRDSRISPNYPNHLSYMPCSTPLRIEQVLVGFFPREEVLKLALDWFLTHKGRRAKVPDAVILLRNKRSVICSVPSCTFQTYGNIQLLNQRVSI